MAMFTIHTNFQSRHSNEVRRKTIKKQDGQPQHAAAVCCKKPCRGNRCPGTMDTTKWPLLPDVIARTKPVRPRSSSRHSQECNHDQDKRSRKSWTWLIRRWSTKLSSNRNPHWHCQWAEPRLGADEAIQERHQPLLPQRQGVQQQEHRDRQAQRQQQNPLPHRAQAQSQSQSQSRGNKNEFSQTIRMMVGERREVKIKMYNAQKRDQLSVMPDTATTSTSVEWPETNNSENSVVVEWRIAKLWTFSGEHVETLDQIRCRRTDRRECNTFLDGAMVIVKTHDQGVYPGTPPQV